MGLGHFVTGLRWHQRYVGGSSFGGISFFIRRLRNDGSVDNDLPKGVSTARDLSIDILDRYPTKCARPLVSKIS